jgi:hypothetical protein
LLRQVGEQTAATYENAQEILKNETPKALPKDASGNDKNSDEENNNPSKANSSKYTSNDLVKLNLMLPSLVFMQYLIFSCYIKMLERVALFLK